MKKDLKEIIYWSLIFLVINILIYFKIQSILIFICISAVIISIVMYLIVKIKKKKGK